MILKTTEKILKKAVCDNCLGRQYAQLLSGYTNKERGSAVKLALAMAIDSGEKTDVNLNNFHGFKFRHQKIKTKKEKCWVCDDLFENLDSITKKILDETKTLEFNTFHIGVTLSNKLLKNEEKFWETAGIEHCESIKTELSREVGKVIEKLTGKAIDFKKPDLVMLVNLNNNTIEINIRSLFIYGKYRKYAKIPQTKWLCLSCKGLGCEKCNFKGKLYPTSVEEKIAKPLLKETQGVTTKFSGAGREDINVQCLDWREFIIEIAEPKKRNINLKNIKNTINKRNKKRIQVSDLEFSDKSCIKALKEKKCDKTYKAVVEFNESVEKLNKLKKLKGTIKQQTPTRVAHRRAEKIRKRLVKSIKYKKITKKKIELEIKAEAGLYIKELISSDNGRTKPSVQELVGIPVKSIELKVIKINK